MDDNELQKNKRISIVIGGILGAIIGLFLLFLLIN